MSVVRTKKAFTLVEIMIVVMIIAILLAIAAPQWVRAREHSQLTSCLSNLREIEHSKQRWAIENRKSGSDTPTAAELAPDFLKGVFPSCSTNGTYTISQVDQLASCSVHGPSDTIP